MLRNHLTVACRNLAKNMFLSCLKVAGLALGIAASLLLVQYISFELSYDTFHQNAGQVYRIRLDSYKNGTFDNSSAISYYAESPTIKASFPEVVNYVRLHRADGMINYYGAGKTVSYYEKEGFYADPSVFTVFSFPLLKGNPRTILRNVNSVAISESAARKYFGDADPIGKVLNLNTEWEGGNYVIEGVFADVPDNSHIRFDFLFAIEKLLQNKQFKTGGWYWTNFYNYLQLRPGTDVRAFEARLPGVIQTHLGKELERSNRKEVFVLQPLEDIHLHSDIFYEAGINSDYKLVYFVLVIAFLIIAIAWLNYVNLSTAKAIERAKEVGIRKVLGAQKGQLAAQFLFESLLLSTVAVGLAGLMLLVARPYFYDLVGKHITVDVYGQGRFWALVIGIFLAGTVLSGIYPAFVLSSFQPLTTLKGRFVGSNRGDLLRKGMVVCQFSASIFLIIATLVINQQLSFMREQNLGININQKLVVRAPRVIKAESFTEESKRFKNELTKYASIAAVAGSSEIPGKEIFWVKEFSRSMDVEENKKMTSVLSVDDNFISSYGIPLVAGRNFSEDQVGDFGGTVIINETALKMLGFKDAQRALGEPLYDFLPVPKKIIGVIKDFHQQSLRKSKTPIVLLFSSWVKDYYTITFNRSQSITRNVALVADVYKNVFPENAFEYFFLDDYFNQQYKAEEQFWRIFTVFSVLAIFIACIGLFGLSSFIIAQRTKEVGIRKVLGGSEASIVSLLSGDFLKLVLVAFALAAPVAWFCMNKWLEGFAYRTTLPAWIFGVSGALALGVAFLTVVFQSLRAALANPIQSLRAE